MYAIGLIILVGVVCAYHFASRWVWASALTITLLYISFYTDTSPWLSLFLIGVVAAGFIPFSVKVWRKRFISKPVFDLFQKMMPQMSSTEKDAIEAGTVSWEGPLFSGAPSWSKLLKQPALHLSEDEQQFLDGPVEELCHMVNEWQITHQDADLPESIWNFIKQEGFLGMIIPKEYGGKGFSEWGHAAVLIKLYTRSSTVATTVGVPNSLGPAELLLNYGTIEQKNHYLPRLAQGKEIPCFALTSPQAGSDAASMPDYGVVTEGIFEGKKVMGIRLNWNKRYITLAPVATVLGLAFKLYDPDKKLSDVVERGITLALIPTNQPGIHIGRRHFPLNTPFMNGPTQGKDVFIPIDWVIGGKEMIGQGWRMLMECLGAGRAISLPSSAAGSSKVAALTTGAYSRIRKQFNLPIGYFDGIQEPLSRIASFAYLIDASIRLTVIAIEQGERPSVASAIVKYHSTELARRAAIDAMDVHAGKGICLGPNNYLARGYQAAPIAITVEGANILTRNLMIFGQGLIRCHPYILSEIAAVEAGNLKDFDNAFFGHMKHSVGNKIRTFISGLTGGRLIFVPTKGGVFRYYQQFSRFSSALAWLSEVAMITLGASLKRRERLSARLGDVLSFLYLGSSVLKRYHDEGYPPEDKPIVDWCCQYLLYQIQESLDDFCQNFPNRIMGYAMRFMVFPLGMWFNKPSDKLSTDVAELVLEPTATLERLVQLMHLTPGPNHPVASLYQAWPVIIAAEPIEKKVHQAFKNGELSELHPDARIREAHKKGVITQREYELLTEAAKLRDEIIRVDDFDSSELQVGKKSRSDESVNIRAV